MSLLNRVSIGILAAAVVSGAEPGNSREDLSEYQVKAAFLLNFARFVEWPPLRNGSNDPLVIGIFGRNPFGDILDQVVGGKTVNGRALVVRRVSEPAGLQSCNLVFIPASDGRRSTELLAALANLSVLTVGESEGFAARGGMINFVVKDGRVHFEVNPLAASRAHLKISSKVLQLAIIVNDGVQSK